MQSFENELSEIARGLHTMEFQCDPEAAEQTMCLQVYKPDGTTDHGCVITSVMRPPLTSENPMPYLFLEPGSQPDPLLDDPATLEDALGMIEYYKHGWCERDAYIFSLQQDIEALKPELAQLTIDNELLRDENERLADEHDHLTEDLLETYTELEYVRSGPRCECDTQPSPQERRLTRFIARATEELRQANQVLLTENQAMFRDNQALCQTNQVLLEENHTLHGANQILCAQSQELLSETQALHQACQALQVDNQALHQACQALQAEKHELHQSCQALQAEKHELNQAHQALQAEKHELNQARQAFQAEHQALHEANQALSAKLASQESAPRPASGSDAEIAELRSQLKFMQGEHAKMAVKFNEADALYLKYYNKAEMFHKAGTELGTINKRLRARIQELETCTELGIINRHLQDRIQELEAELEGQSCSGADESDLEGQSCSGTDESDDGHSAQEYEKLQAEYQRLQDFNKSASARFDMQSQDQAKQIAALESQLAASAVREADANRNLNAQGVRITALKHRIESMDRLAAMPRWGDAADKAANEMGF